MKWENKAGLAVLGSFLVLAGVVGTLKYREQMTPASPDDFTQLTAMPKLTVPPPLKTEKETKTSAAMISPKNKEPETPVAQSGATNQPAQNQGVPGPAAAGGFTLPHNSSPRVENDDQPPQQANAKSEPLETTGDKAVNNTTVFSSSIAHEASVGPPRVAYEASVGPPRPTPSMIGEEPHMPLTPQPPLSKLTPINDDRNSRDGKLAQTKNDSAIELTSGTTGSHGSPPPPPAADKMPPAPVSPPKQLSPAPPPLKQGEVQLPPPLPDAPDVNPPSGSVPAPKETIPAKATETPPPAPKVEPGAPVGSSPPVKDPASPKDLFPPDVPAKSATPIPPPPSPPATVPPSIEEKSAPAPKSDVPPPPPPGAASPPLAPVPPAAVPPPVPSAPVPPPGPATPPGPVTPPKAVENPVVKTPERSELKPLDKTQPTGKQPERSEFTPTGVAPTPKSNAAPVSSEPPFSSSPRPLTGLKEPAQPLQQAAFEKPAPPSNGAPALVPVPVPSPIAPPPLTGETVPPPIPGTITSPPGMPGTGSSTPAPAPVGATTATAQPLAVPPVQNPPAPAPVGSSSTPTPPVTAQPIPLAQPEAKGAAIAPIENRQPVQEKAKPAPIGATAKLQTATVIPGSNSAFRPIVASNGTVTRTDITIYRVKQTDSWESISKEHYFTEKCATALREFNKRSTRAKLQKQQEGGLTVGDTVVIPPLVVLENEFGLKLPLVEPEGQAPAPLAPGVSGFQPGGAPRQ